MHFLAILAVSLLLSATSLVAEPISVHDIQFTEAPDGTSPLNGQTVEVAGIVTGYGFSNGLRYFISDPGGGPWSGIQVNETQTLTLAIGDSIVLQATVEESGTETRLRVPAILFGRHLRRFPLTGRSLPTLASRWKESWFKWTHLS